MTVEYAQQNAALVEEAAAAAESLEEEAQSLTRSVSVFKLAEGQQIQSFFAPTSRARTKSAIHPATSNTLLQNKTASNASKPKISNAGEEWEEF